MKTCVVTRERLNANQKKEVLRGFKAAGWNGSFDYKTTRQDLSSYETLCLLDTSSNEAIELTNKYGNNKFYVLGSATSNVFKENLQVFYGRTGEVLGKEINNSELVAEAKRYSELKAKKFSEILCVGSEFMTNYGSNLVETHTNETPARTAWAVDYEDILNFSNENPNEVYMTTEIDLNNTSKNPSTLFWLANGSEKQLNQIQFQRMPGEEELYCDLFQGKEIAVSGRAALAAAGVTKEGHYRPYYQRASNIGCSLNYNFVPPALERADWDFLRI